MPKKDFTKTTRSNFKHRGRIQAQGEKKFDESETWAQNNAPTKNAAIQMTDNLIKKIPNFQAKIREKQFEELKKFIIKSPQNGVSAPVSKTYLVKNTKHERVDLEIKKGIAFIDD
jgi:hypothetical protein